MNQKITENNKRTWQNTETRQKRIDGILKARYRNKDPRLIFDTELKPLLDKGISANKMISYGIKLSNPTILKLIRCYGTEEDLKKLKENCSRGKSVTSLNRKGEVSKLKGRTYEQILGSKEKAESRANITRNWMKERNIRKFATKISKPQKLLFEIIKAKYPNAIMEYEVQLEERKVYLDIAEPNLKLNFEYDGLHWHKNQKHIKYSDERRDEELQNLGWKVFRFQFWSNANNEQLQEKIKEFKL